MAPKVVALSIYELINVLSVYAGITTANGAAGGTTLVDSALNGVNDYVTNKTVLILDGACARETQPASTFNPAAPATITTPAFSAQIVAGVNYRIINSPALANILVNLLAVKAQTDKLAGAIPVVGSTTANWQSGAATSGEVGADLVTIGANDTKTKIHSAFMSIALLTNLASITVRAYIQINGTERKFYQQNFTRGIDPDGVLIITGTIGVHEAVRVEVQSDTAADNGLAISYDYFTELM